MTITFQPLNARLWFRLRETINWTTTFVFFVLLFYPLILVTSAFVAGLISITAAFVLFFYVLDKWAIRIPCSNSSCGEFIETNNTPWICGNKGCRNDNLENFPFIYRCAECGYYPKSYKCHHCGELIHFTHDKQKTDFAICAITPSRSELVKKHRENIVEKHEEIEIKELDLTVADLESKLHGLKPPVVKIKGVAEEWQEFMSRETADEDEAERWRTKVMAQFPESDPERAKRLALIDKFRRRRL
jgi:hypothetical protein